MAAIGQAEQFGGRRSRHRRDFAQSIFARQRRQRRHRQRLRRQAGRPLGPHILVHQQREDLGVGRERRAIRVIGGEEHAPWVIDQQEQLQAGGELHRVVEAAGAIFVRHDAAAVRIPVDDRVFLRPRLTAGGELPQHVGRDRHRLAEHHLPDVDGHILGCVDRFGELRRGGGKALRTLLAVAVELKMRQMQRQVLRRGDRRERGFEVSGQAKIVAVDMQRMRHAGFVHRLLQRLDDRATRHAVIGNHVVKRKAADVVLERRDAAGVDDLDPKRARRLQCPGDMIAERACAFARTQEAEHEIVIAEDRQNRLVDDRGVGKFEMRVQGVVRRDRRLDHGREAHLGIEPPRLERRPTDFGERRLGGAARVGAMVFGQHEAGGVHVRARDMRMDVDAAGHRDKPARVHRLVRLGAVLRGCDDCIVADPKIADFVAAVGGIDDMRALDAGQHGEAFASSRRAPMRSRA